MGKHHNALREENDRLKKELAFYETRQNNAWKPWQLIALKDMAGKYPPSDIATVTGRSKSSVQNKAQSLGLSLGLKPRKPWTNYEKEKARKMVFAGSSVKEVAEALERTEHAVRDKLYRR